ncbi:polysaccharide biosynthesis/export family protein [Pelagibacterium halotolerans]|uniref:polysaccharide biosynthesis/export family protein n=1 Tax=Pelagibacterium halotolerans TaxID=531813 RepID=UPI00384B4FDC
MRVPRFLLVLLLPLLLAACAHAGGPATYLVEQTGPYRLDSGDVVRVTVYGDANLTNTYRVDDSGAIALPLVGAIPARGLTAEVVGSRITAALANGFMRNPNVAVEVAEYRPFFIQGAVASPGALPYVYGMTARAAISAAGGFTEVANRDSAVIYRRQGSDMVRGSVGLDFPILPGDTIVISERWL